MVRVSVAAPNNNNMAEKWPEKKAKCAELAIEIQQIWHTAQVEVVSLTGI